MNLVIRIATVDDAANLTEFAKRIFFETFADHPHNKAEDMAVYLAKTYGIKQQMAEIVDSFIKIIVIEADQKLIGYGQLRQSNPPNCVISENSLELQRFYIDQAWHGRAMADQLMQKVFETAASWSARTLWLAVSEQTPRAIAFFKKYNFVDVGECQFFFGNDVQSGRIMSLRLGNA